MLQETWGSVCPAAGRQVLPSNGGDELKTRKERDLGGSGRLWFLSKCRFGFWANRFMLLSDNFANKLMTQSAQQMGFFSWGRNYWFCPKGMRPFFFSKKLLSGKCDYFSFQAETQLFQLTPSYASGLLSNMQKFSLEISNLWQFTILCAGENNI